MNCSENQELLSAYYDNELAANMRSRMSDHLDGCSECPRELARFEKLSMMAIAPSVPAPPEHLWSQIEQQLDWRPHDEQPVTESVDPSRRWSSLAPRLFALAATIFVALGIGWFTYPSWFVHGEQDPFTVEFGNYLEEFRRDPDAAQQILLAKYESRVVSPNQAIEWVGYRPAVADGLPDGYTLESTHVMKMPCCTCVQSVCERSDGSTLAIFEHDDDRCNNEPCCLVELDDPIAASWKRGERHITLIGVRDVAEVSQIVAWLD